MLCEDGSWHYEAGATWKTSFYSDDERLQIYISDVGIIAVCYFSFSSCHGKRACLGCVWWWLRSCIILRLHCRTTNSSEWDWLRGALVTVDRDYGILNKVFHNITDTHVVHHLFSTMPHYHAMVATKAIKLILGEYYLLKECIYVELDTENRGVFSYIGKFWWLVLSRLLLH